MIKDPDIKRCPHCAGGGSVCEFCGHSSVKVTKRGKLQLNRTKCGANEAGVHRWIRCSKCDGAGLTKGSKL